LRAGASDADLLELVRGAWHGRSNRYSERREELRLAGAALHKIEMFYIGG
jgi:hypothetical protein